VPRVGAVSLPIPSLTAGVPGSESVGPFVIVMSHGDSEARRQLVRDDGSPYDSEDPLDVPRSRRTWPK
jgi:hypothetical protein